MSVPTRAILMYKAPHLGSVKTRLAKRIGEVAALELYRWMGLRQLDAIPSDWEIETRFSPENEEPTMREWLGSRTLLNTQGKGDLGDRMLRAADSCFGVGAKRKIIFMGADCLELDERLLRKAEAALEASDFVLGPALDGGYYLLGMNDLETSLFEGIQWGSESVLNETIGRIQGINKSYVLLEELVDVDYWEDLVGQRESVDPKLWERLSLPEA